MLESDSSSLVTPAAKKGQATPQSPSAKRKTQESTYYALENGRALFSGRQQSEDSSNNTIETKESKQEYGLETSHSMLSLALESVPTSGIEEHKRSGEGPVPD